MMVTMRRLVIHEAAAKSKDIVEPSFACDGNGASEKYTNQMSIANTDQITNTALL